MARSEEFRERDVTAKVYSGFSRLKFNRLFLFCFCFPRRRACVCVCECVCVCVSSRCCDCTMYSGVQVQYRFTAVAKWLEKEIGNRHDGASRLANGCRRLPLLLSFSTGRLGAALERLLYTASAGLCPFSTGPARGDCSALH